MKASVTSKRQNVHSARTQNTTSYWSSPSLRGFCFTRNLIRISYSKIISHSLWSIQVEDEYCQSTNERLIRGKIAPKASAKFRAALFFTEPPPQRRGGVDDEPGAPSIRALRSTHKLPSPILLDRCGPWENVTLDPPTGPTSGPQRYPRGQPHLTDQSAARAPQHSHSMIHQVRHQCFHRDDNQPSKKKGINHMNSTKLQVNHAEGRPK
jgi:hypothetical protein